MDGGIINRWEILTESGHSSGRSFSQASKLIESASGGRRIFFLAADRGLYSAENEKRAQQAGVKRVVLPKSGRTSREREHHEKQRWFKRGFRFRAGIEGRISVL